MALEDYGGLIQAGMNLVPDIGAQLARQGLLDAQAQTMRAEAAATTQKISRLQQFQRDIATYDGSPASASKLIAQYPEYADHIKQAWDVQDSAKKQSDLTSLGEIYSAAQSGNWQLAKQLAHSRADAEKANGHSDPAYDAALDILDKAADGDTTQQKVALNLMGAHLAAVTGPDHFGTVFGQLNGSGQGYTLNAGAARYDSDGHMVAHSPFIQDANGNIRLWTDNTSPDASPPPQNIASSGGFDNAVATVLDNEGGYNPKDMNGAPVKFGINAKANAAELKKLGVTDVKDLTRDQAIQIYKAKYWDASGADQLPANLQTPYFDVYIRNPAMAKHALAQSGGDPAKFMALSSAYFQNLAKKPNGQRYAQAWATRDANNLAIATGTASPEAAAPAAAAASDATSKFPVIIPGKPQAAPAGFRWAPDGKSLEPIPGGPADDSGLDPATVEFYAQNYLTTGQLPPLGMGKSATKTRQQIMKQAAKIAGADGLTGTDLALQMAHYRAGVANISNLEKQLGTVSGNEATFAQNAQQVAELSRKLPSQTGSRILNTPIQSYLRQTNDPTVAALDVAIKTAANEYARLVTASPSGAGTLSDSARMEYQGIIEGNFPLKQKLSALHQMSVDANNRTKSLRSTLQDAYGHLSDRAPELRGGGSRQPPAGATKTATGPNGEKAALVNGHWVKY